VGSRGNALVLASAPLSFTCRWCGARQDEILENIASGPALVARYQARTLRRVADGYEVMAAVDQGDKLAEEVVRTAGDALGNSVGWLINVLDPDAVVVGGGLGLSGGVFWQSFVASTRAHVWSEATRGLPIITAALAVDSGIIGAALAAGEATSVVQGRR
jgi:glucokinase